MEDEWMVRIQATGKERLNSRFGYSTQAGDWLVFQPKAEISWLYGLAVQLRGKGVHIEGLVRSATHTPMAFRIADGELGS